jgi:hypothetical protein
MGAIVPILLKNNDECLAADADVAVGERYCPSE